jgi:hypothetical protein
VPSVEKRIDAVFDELGASALVCSAACGADLLALRSANARGMRRRIILPFAKDEFRVTSVIDRPGDDAHDWGSIFDRQIGTAGRDVLTLAFLPGSDAAYAAANHAILDEASRLAGDAGQVIAVVVWNGQRREGTDHTASFMDEARRRRLRMIEVPTGSVE